MPSLGNGLELSCNQLLPTPIPLVNDDDDDSNDDADADEYGDYYGDDHADDDDNGNGDNDDKNRSKPRHPATHPRWESSVVRDWETWLQWLNNRWDTLGWLCVQFIFKFFLQTLRLV